MASFKNHLILTAIFTLLAANGMTMNSRQASASGAAPVNIVSPLPVPVRATQIGAWNPVLPDTDWSQCWQYTQRQHRQFSYGAVEPHVQHQRCESRDGAGVGLECERRRADCGSIGEQRVHTSSLSAPPCTATFAGRSKRP